MSASNAADTIRILVSTDNHVGYKERDPIRGDDSWKSFHEVMCLAKERDVDMVLLAGDLFHENKPSRKSMYHVMRSLRMNCYGDKPCELEMLSDASEMFAGAFNHVNYEDPDINVAIPVFSIHGNHDDPSGENGLAALDLLQMSGLANYYGRTPESDNISIKPVLLQKGSTKLALYGMSNVRDERLFRTFRDGNVKFFRPGTQKDDWFNLMSVHQNHHAHTETSYLPEKFLPSFLDLVVWGHEHECILEPQTNAEQGFRVIQPGSSVATSLMPGEAVPKKVAILSITGKEMKIETIRLTTVRPFVMREVSLMASREMRELAMQTDDTKPKLSRYLMDIVEELIEEAKQQWLKVQREAGADQDEEVEIPKPLIRLRVDYTAPDGGEFDLENPQRFSNRFMDRVANTSDVVQFHRKRQARKSIKGKADMPEDSVLAQMEMDTVKIGQLVDEFLAAQSLTILPQNTFSDAVGQFVDKDDRTAMEQFVAKSLESLVSHLIDGDEDEEVDEERVAGMMEEYKAKVEEAFAKGEIKRGNRRKGSRKPRPEGWDSEDDGAWEDNPASIVRDEEGNVLEEADGPAPKAKSTRGRGGKAAAGTTRKTAAAAKKAPSKGRGKKVAMSEEDDDDDDEDDDVVMANSPDVIEVDDDEEEALEDDDDDDDGVFVKPAAKKAAAKKAPAKKAAPAKATKSVRAGTQSKLAFGGSPASQRASGRAAPSRAAEKAPPKRAQEPSDDEISDDDAFEPPPPVARGKARR
ncbi:meiotic recombination [Friedmanniomyces endolithicus]|nr:meiotic recombination [Friedmanniomyces endolithicus]KAK0290018.1 meiotic recombination [Friedmanniomyces endolithicus]KAK1017234.1 meiotic recombination [Friedmanniomyces endolithicus]